MSNANGLVAGNPHGGVYGDWTSPSGAKFPLGSLVGSLDGGKTFFLVGTQYDAFAPQAGVLSLCFWDVNHDDNSGSISASIDTTPAEVFPAGTKWSVAGIDHDLKYTAFHPTPWEFQQGTMNAGTLWKGSYRHVPGTDNRIVCEITMAGATRVGDIFEVVFVAPDRFLANKNGVLYRFGKRI